MSQAVLVSGCKPGMATTRVKGTESSELPGAFCVGVDGASFSLAPSLSLLLLELLLPVLLSLLLDELLSDLSPISSLRFKGLPH